MSNCLGKMAASSRFNFYRLIGGMAGSRILTTGVRRLLVVKDQFAGVGRGFAPIQ